MRFGPPVQFVHRPDGRNLAYQVVGEAPLDLVFLFGWPTHLGLLWENPSFAAFLGKLSSVVVFGSHPATLRDDDYPWGATPEERECVFALIEAAAPSETADTLLAALAPREAGDPSVRSWFRMFSASASSPVESIDGIRSLGPVDIRGLLGSIQAPVLVLHRTGDRMASVHASRYMADRIPGARMVELAGDDHLPFFGDSDTVVALTQEFLTGATPVVEPDRVLATVLLTDIVDSTRLAADLGDRRWHRLLVDHQETVRQQLGRFRGREVKTTGEVELLGEDIGGIAVHIAARLLGAAGPGEIVCSRTVKDLVAEEREVVAASQLHEADAGDPLGHVAAGSDVG